MLLGGQGDEGSLGPAALAALYLWSVAEIVLSRPNTGKSSLIVPKPASPCSVCPLVCDAVLLSFVATKGQREVYREIILTLRLSRLEPCVVRPTQTLDILVRRIV